MFFRRKKSFFHSYRFLLRDFFYFYDYRTRRYGTKCMCCTTHVLFFKRSKVQPKKLNNVWISTSEVNVKKLKPETVKRSFYFQFKRCIFPPRRSMFWTNTFFSGEKKSAEFIYCHYTTTGGALCLLKNTEQICITCGFRVFDKNKIQPSCIATG